MKINRGKDISDVKDKLKHIKLDEVKNDEIVFDSNQWSKEFKPQHKLLSFTYKGKQKGPIKCKFVIPCVLKDSIDEVVLEITLTIIDIEEVKDETPKDGQQEPKDSIPQDSTMITI